MPSTETQKAAGLEINIVTDAADMAACFDCQVQSFALGIQDYAWTTLFRGWDTPDGRQKHITGLEKRFQAITKDGKGRPNSIFLKATMPDPKNAGQRVVAGVAIWEQCSFVDGHGNAPTLDAEKALDLDDISDSPSDKLFVTQLFSCMFKSRYEVTKERSTSDPPAIFVLDICAVDPAFWRRGIARQLVQWGVDEAKRRGGLECTTEASAMGRHVYQKLGFQPVKEIEFPVDDKERGQQLPSNLFMRTQPS